MSISYEDEWPGDFNRCWRAKKPFKRLDEIAELPDLDEPDYDDFPRDAYDVYVGPVYLNLDKLLVNR